MPHRYIDGQRAEVSWVFQNGITWSVLREQSEIADQALRYVGQHFLGWQEVNYERWVSLCCMLSLIFLARDIDCIHLCPLFYDSVKERARVMARAGRILTMASNNAMPTMEQQHFLATAYNTHLASGPTMEVRATPKPC